MVVNPVIERVGNHACENAVAEGDQLIPSFPADCEGLPVAFGLELTERIGVSRPAAGMAVDCARHLRVGEFSIPEIVEDIGTLSTYPI